MIRIVWLMLLTSCLVFSSCDKPTPKPKGYFRIDTPKSTYQKFEQGQAPFTFNYPSVCDVRFENKGRNISTLVISYPRYHARILCNYSSMQRSEFRDLAEESRQFVYRHSIKAAAISEEYVMNKNAQTYGLFYELKGNVATPFQFSITDSTRHFLRGSLYIDSTPKADSLAPVVTYVKGHILELMKSLRWKN